MPSWFAYENQDLYISYNIVFGDFDDMETWTECFECQNKHDAETLASILNKIEAGPYADTASVKTAWQEKLREGQDIRTRLGPEKKHSSIA